MTTLTEFLLARIAEDESAATTAGGDSWQSWSHRGGDSELRDLTIGGARVAELPTDLDEHITRWDPARVLAECETKKGIIKHHLVWEQTLHRQGSDDYTEGEETMYRMAMQWVIHQMLQPYAGHPQFQPEWRPAP